MKGKPDRKVGLAVEALTRLLKYQLNAWQLWLVFDCLVAYSEMDKEQKKEFEALMTSEPYKSSFRFTPTWYDEGMEKGRQLGMQAMLMSQLEGRFGPLSERVRQLVESLPEEKLLDLANALLNAESLSALGLDI